MSSIGFDAAFVCLNPGSPEGTFVPAASDLQSWRNRARRLSLSEREAGLCVCAADVEPDSERWASMTRSLRQLMIVGAIVTVVAGLLLADPHPAPGIVSAAASVVGIHKIKHIIVVMQENRSFDNYFGTFPGADGIPMKDGVPSTCSPDSGDLLCVAPFVDHHDVNQGGPHGARPCRRHRRRQDGRIRRSLLPDPSCVSIGTPNAPTFRPAAT